MQVVACVKSSQSRLSLERVNSMTNKPWHKLTNSFLAVAMRKTLISNSWSCPWCSRGFWAQRTGYKHLVPRGLQILLVLLLTALEHQPAMLSEQILPKYFHHIFKIRLSHKPISHRKPNIQNHPLSFSAQPCGAFQYDSTWYSHPTISYCQASPLSQGPWPPASPVTHEALNHTCGRSSAQGPSLSSSQKKRWRSTSWKQHSAIWDKRMC